MKYLIVTHTSAPGGAELCVRDYLRKSRLDDVTIASFEPAGVWEGLQEHGVRLISTEARSHLARVRWLAGVIRREQPDLVLANTMRAGVHLALALPRGQKMAYWLHDALGRESAMSRLANVLTRYLALPRSFGFLVNSVWTERTLRRWVPYADSVVVPSPTGISQAELERTPGRPAPGPEDPVRLLFLGRLTQWKAPHVAVEALDELERRYPGRFSLSIAGAAHFGEDEYAGQLAERIEASPSRDRIHLLGHVANPAELFAEHDLLVHCSVVPEPYGRVLTEAMARALPVVATDAGAPADFVVPGQCGELYAPGDPQALVAAIERALVPQRYAAESAGAPQVAIQFADEPVVARADEAMERWRGQALRELRAP